MDRTLVRVAFDAGDQPYLDAEKEIVAAGARLHPVIREEAARRGPLEAAIAAVLVGWASEEPTWRKCFARLDALEKKYTRSPIGYPPPDAVGNILTEEFGNSCAPVLAVRLLKEGASWPFWKAAGVLLHLRDVRDPRSTEPLVRFFLSTKEADLARIAAEALHGLGAGARLEAELHAFKARTETLEAALRAAAGK